jgi:hypothetical protein
LLGKEPGAVVIGVHLANTGKEFVCRDEIVLVTWRLEQCPDWLAVWRYWGLVPCLACLWVPQTVAQRMEPDAACCALGLRVFASRGAVVYLLYG